MKKTFLLIIGVITIAACTKSKVSTEVASPIDSFPIKKEISTMYGQTDSTFTVNGKVLRVKVTQFDMTDQAMRLGDTLSRPTYSCTVKIFDAENKVVYKDSVLRDSWGYKGKTLSIDSYQIALPQLSLDGKEIILAFNIYESDYEDAIEGCIGFDIDTREPRYFWRETTLGD